MNRKIILPTIILFATSSIFSQGLVLATENTSLQDAMKQHPNASFNINSHNNSYTFTYSQEVSGNQQQIYTQPETSNFPNFSTSNESNENHETFKIPNSTITNEKNETNTPSTSERDEKIIRLSRDQTGIINTLDSEASLIDETESLNNRIVDENGKPIALGNGKVHSKQLFTSKDNLYTRGQCTYYVFDKRAADKNTISTFWGDAKHWANQASQAGFEVNHTPKAGAILQTTEGFYGHVAYVERVNKNGSVLISEMNYIAPFITSTRLLSPSEASGYQYIH